MNLSVLEITAYMLWTPGHKFLLRLFLGKTCFVHHHHVMLSQHNLENHYRY